MPDLKEMGNKILQKIGLKKKEEAKATSGESPAISAGDESPAISAGDAGNQIGLS
jgi:hypothetical protein